jgi:hypothetical protein
MALTSRRDWLSGLLALGAAAAFGRRTKLALAAAADVVTVNELGVTLKFTAKNAPFPHAGSSYEDASVWVFVPHHHRALQAHGAHRGQSAIVHFHGHNNTAEKAMLSHQLREQLVDSKQNAVLIVPQGPVMAADSSCGSLAEEGAFKLLVLEALAKTRGVLSVLASKSKRADSASARVRVPDLASEEAGLDKICVSAHSGGYHAAATVIKHGGLDVNEVFLFDALYADVPLFQEWVLSKRSTAQSQRHKLVSYVTGGAPKDNSEALFVALEKEGLRCLKEVREGTLSRTELVQADYVLVASSLNHGEVTSTNNALRDCLLASALPRRVATDWFARKTGPRVIERRPH